MEKLQESDPPTSWYYVQINAVPHFSYISTKSDICHEVLARKKNDFHVESWALVRWQLEIVTFYIMGPTNASSPKKMRPREGMINHHCPQIWPFLLWSYIFSGGALKWKILTLSTLLGGHGSWPSSALGKGSSFLTWKPQAPCVYLKAPGVSRNQYMKIFTKRVAGQLSAHSVSLHLDIQRNSAKVTFQKGW